MAAPTSWLSKTLSVIVVVLIIAVGYVFFKATSKSDNENYGKGSTHYEYAYSFVQNLSPLSWQGCTPFVRMDTPDGIKYSQPVKKEPKK